MNMIAKTATTPLITLKKATSLLSPRLPILFSKTPSKTQARPHPRPHRLKGQPSPRSTRVRLLVRTLLDLEASRHLEEWQGCPSTVAILRGWLLFTTITPWLLCSMALTHTRWTRARFTWQTKPPYSIPRLVTRIRLKCSTSRPLSPSCKQTTLLVSTLSSQWVTPPTVSLIPQCCSLATTLSPK